MTQTPQRTKPLRGAHDLGEIIGYGYRIYLRYFRVMFGLALLTVPLPLLGGVLQARFDGEGVDLGVQALQLAGVFVSLIASGALTYATHDVSGGEPPAFNRALDAAFERAGALFSTLLLATALGIASLAAGPLLAVFWLFNREATVDGERNWWLATIPFALTIYLIIRWQLNAQAVMIAGKRNWAALDECAEAVRGHWWRAFAIILMVGLVVAGPIILASYATALPPLPGAAIVSGVSALVTPFVVIAQTLLYYDLKARNAAVVAAPVEAMETEEAQG